MPRKRRNHISQTPCLVVARAASNTSLFYDDEDYLNYLSLLRQLVRDRLLTVYAFCLRPEELRLVLKSGRLGLGKIMQRLHGSHTLRINSKLQRSGSLFRGRYESKPLLESNLCSVVRAVHLWPVRTGAVRHAEFFRYSSHATYLGRGERIADFLKVEAILDQFSKAPAISQKAFSKYVESVALDTDEDGIVDAVLLDEDLIVKHEPKKNNFLKGLAKRISLLLSVNPVNLRGPSRRQELVMARRLMATKAVLDADRTVTEVAKYLGRDKAQVSRLVSQGMDLLDADEAFRVLYDSIWQTKKRAVET